MCGVVGYGGFSKRVSLEKAIKAIKHRGPDDNGIVYIDDVALGNTRLAIIDLSNNGHQPMFNSDKSLCISFNGEIYNFLDIKKLLQDKYPFKSNSDTEVILYAYQEWGFKCLEKLGGMFSFVIYDRKNKLLFGARDRLGQKPLKYYYARGKLIFASEIKAILQLLDHKIEIDEVAIDNFLTFQYVPAPKTGFKNIYKLPAGHFFVFKNKQLSVKRYWSLNFNKKFDLPPNELEEQIFAEISKAVKSHLVSDVPVGALLSGGLDSSMVVALMALNSSKPINTFSIGFDDVHFDESFFAKIVSKLYKTKHTHLTVTSKDFIENLKNIIKIYDEPIADNSILPTALVAKLASQKVKVALTGDGGDENFAGYDRYFFINIAAKMAELPVTFKKMVGFLGKQAALLHPSKQTRRAYIFLSTLNQPTYRMYVNYNAFFSHREKHDLYTNDFRKVVDKNDSFETFKDHFDSNIDALDNALKLDINTYLPDDLLYKTDSAAGAYGLELRSPFLDHKLMEKIAAIPSKDKLQFGKKKKILKDIALKHNLLPKEIVNRGKQGFIIPQNKWFKNSLKEYIYDNILHSNTIDYIFEQDKIKHYLDNYFNSNLNYDNNIFALLMLAIWVDKYH